jgi:NAD(P)-dependent dehydrogenase (short-subunit alcohol dehydrogenase family)
VDCARPRTCYYFVHDPFDSARGAMNREVSASMSPALGPGRGEAGPPGAVVITGASSGIGQVTALALARAGWLVFAGIRSAAAAERLAALAGAIGAGALVQPLPLDVTEDAQISAAVAFVGEKCLRHGTPLRGVINNAGIAVAGPLEVVPLERVRVSLAINTIGALAVTRAFLPQLRASRGRIINLSSVSGRVASPFLGPYSASKFALEALSDALRVELRPWGVQVILIEPGPIATPIWEKGDTLAVDDGAALDASPYAPFLPRVRVRFLSAAASGQAPDVVAATILRALTVSRPRPRYLLTHGPLGFTIFARYLPDQWRDLAFSLALGLRGGAGREHIE